MNTYLWFYIFNSDEFEASGLVSRTYSLVLDGIGQKDILVTQGNLLGMTYEETYLALNLNDQEVTVMDDFAIYRDTNKNVWLGFLQ